MWHSSSPDFSNDKSFVFYLPKRKLPKSPFDVVRLFLAVVVRVNICPEVCVESEVDRIGEKNRVLQADNPSIDLKVLVGEAAM